MTDQFWCGNIACFNVTKVQAQYVLLKIFSTVWCFRCLIFVDALAPFLQNITRICFLTECTSVVILWQFPHTIFFCKINKVVDGMFHFGRNLMYYFCPFTDFMYVWWFQENEPEGQISQTLKELRNFTLAPPLPDFQVRHLVSELKSTATRSESQSRCWKTQKAPGLGLRLGLHQFTSKALSEKSTVMAKSQKKDTNIRFLFEA